MKQNKTAKEYAKELRKNMTQEERRLWYLFLKDLPQMVHRQKVIGGYIVDFYIASAKLVIEIDGSQHYEEEAKKQDEKRDEYLKEQGLTVCRYSNYDVNRNFSGVCEDIIEHIKRNPTSASHSSAASPQGEAK